MSDPRVEVRTVSWQDEHARDVLQRLRFEVFVYEQGVPEDMEIDDEETSATHYLALDAASGEALGCARLTLAHKVTRLCVVKAARHRGVGTLLLQRTIDDARARGWSELHLHAQTYAAGLYEKAGFVASGEEFMEAGIPHQRMDLSLVP
ncbi:MAG: GNAT family N-acetyltransferase [Myxococcales bacterium]|nr:GNAT family N-acetyltransferase [Myxococcales bacterium]